MDFLSVKPGLVFWSIVNFLFFLAALYLIGGKNFIKNILQREEFIKDSIEEAERAQLKAKNINSENEIKLRDTYKTVDEMLQKGKQQAEAQAHIIIAEAEKNRNVILRQANEEIERNKIAAIKEIRSEVADLVIGATEKVLGDKLTTEKDTEIIENYIKELANKGQEQ